MVVCVNGSGGVSLHGMVFVEVAGSTEHRCGCPPQAERSCLWGRNRVDAWATPDDLQGGVCGCVGVVVWRVLWYAVFLVVGLKRGCGSRVGVWGWVVVLW